MSNLSTNISIVVDPSDLAEEKLLEVCLHYLNNNNRVLWVVGNNDSFVLRKLDHFKMSNSQNLMVIRDSKLEEFLEQSSIEVDHVIVTGILVNQELSETFFREVLVSDIPMTVSHSCLNEDQLSFLSNISNNFSFQEQITG